MRKIGSRNINAKYKVIFLYVVVCLCSSFFAGCGGSSYMNSADKSSEEIGFQEYYNETADMAAEDDAAMESEEAESGVSEENTGNGTAQESLADSQKKILVYEGSVSIDTLEFEDAVRAFRKTVEECGGFLEDEQSRGTGSNYEEDSSYRITERRTFHATARVPSDKYQDFMQKTEGIGKVTESNSKVTNMTRQYGTLKAELEIYEAEYQRYLKMFDEVSDDNAMISIQEKLTELSLNIARTKSEMSVIDTDAAYSTVYITIFEVSAYKENSAGFLTRLGNVVSDSWEGMLAFFEGILFFFILHWYKLLLLALIVFFIVKFVKKYDEKSRQKRQQAMQAYQQKQREEEAGQKNNQEEAIKQENHQIEEREHE